MYPLLFKLGPVPIHAYGVMIALGFLVAVYTIVKLSRTSGLDLERTLDLVFWCFIVGFVGARLYFVGTRWGEQFSEDLGGIFRVWEGGLVFYGGPLAAVPFGIWYVFKHKLPAWRSADVLIPGLAVAHAFGRIGCFFAGCCYGRPTGHGWGLVFHGEQVDAPLRGIPLHPTQLYESTALFILFAGLIWVYRHRKFDGQVALTYFMAYPIIRSIVEVFRGDIIRGFLIEGVLSWGQFTSILVFLAAAWVLKKRLKEV